MQGGFSFCGVDIYKLGLEYAPEMSDTYVFSPANRNIQEQKIDAHEGGYFYGVNTDVKDFTLRCYFENSDVLDGIMTAVQNFFYVGKTGKLIFKKRPWCWYIATVISTDANKMFNYRNGFITIKMRAYYPYARSDYRVIEPYDLCQYDMLKNSAILNSLDKLPPTQLISSGNRMTEATSFLLYNAGTERAKVAIEIAGNVGDGVSIANATTGQLCKFVAISDAITTNDNKYIVSDALSGKTVLTNGSQSELAFLYHDNGFMDLEPAYPILRNVVEQHEEGSQMISLSMDVSTELIGKYIYIENVWRKIININGDNQICIENTLQETAFSQTEIVTMNEITVTPVGTMSLSRLNFEYKPTFS